MAKPNLKVSADVDEAQNRDKDVVAIMRKRMLFTSDKDFLMDVWPSKHVSPSRYWGLSSVAQPVLRPISPSKRNKSSVNVYARAATPQSSSSEAGPSVVVPASTKPKDKGKQKIGLRKRSKKFWHPDGSVVVQVQNTLFRLHRSRLMQHSQFFADLFASGGRSEEEPSLDIIEKRDVVDSDCIYQVKGVSALDFERLLTALEAGIAYAINPPPFHILASLLRAVYTLSFKTVLLFATHLLREMWPQDLSRLPPATPERRAHAIETVLLGQQCAIPEVRKPAFYELLRGPGAFGQDLAAYTHCPASAAEAAVPNVPETDADETRAPLPRLAASDLVRLAAAKDALQKRWVALVHPPLPSASPCPLSALLRYANKDADAGAGGDAAESSAHTAARECARAREADEAGWKARLLQNGVLEAGLVDGFEGTRRLVEMEWGEMGYCVRCVGERRDAWKEERERLWKWLDVLLATRWSEA